MFHAHRSRLAGKTPYGIRVPAVVAAIAIAAGAAGCSSGGTAAKTTTKTNQGTQSTQNTQTNYAYTAAQLRDALLAKVHGARPAVPVEAGAYGTLPGVKATRATVTGVKITPAKCATASGTGLSSPKYNKVPATVATFRDGTDGVSEVLLSPPSALLNSALVRKIPAGCSHYLARVGNRTFTYSLKEERAPRIGDAASELNVRASGDASANIWTIIYRTGSMVGAITMVGEHASRAGAEALAKAAYAHAAKSLV
jgi:hypothetical protein